MKSDKASAPLKGSNAVKIEKLPSSRYSRQQTRTKTRTSNACEACKRRKTKCTGSPSPCDVCVKAETYCCFNPKLDTRRKVAYSSTNVQDRQQFMITALLQTIKHSSEDDLQHLIRLIRGPSRPDEVATCLQGHFTALQSKNLVSKMAFDSTDVISFALQGLCGHRKGRPRPGVSGAEDDADLLSPKSRKSFVSEADGSSNSNQDMIDDESESKADGAFDRSPSSIGGEDEQLELEPTEMFNFAANDPHRHEDFQGMHNVSAVQMVNRPHFGVADFVDPETKRFPPGGMGDSFRYIQPFDSTSFPGMETNMPNTYPMAPTFNESMQRYLHSQAILGPHHQMMDYLHAVQQGRTEA